MADDSNVHNPDEIDLSKVARKVRNRLPLVIGLTALGGLLGLAYTAVIKPQYQARATVFFPVRPPSVLGASSISDIASSSASALLGSGPSPIKVFRGFLESERTMDIVVRGSGYSRADIEDARRFEEQPLANTLSVFAIDPSPDKAQKLVALHVRAMREINSELSVGSLADDERVLKAKLTNERARLAAAQDRLLEFQRNAVTAPSGTPPSVALKENGGSTPAASPWAAQLRSLEVELKGLTANLEAGLSRIRESATASPQLPTQLPPEVRYRPQLVDAEYELALKEKTLGPENQEIVDLRSKVAVLRQKLKSEIVAYAKSASLTLVDPDGANLSRIAALRAQIAALKRLADLAPKEADELERLRFQVTVESGLVQQLTTQSKLAEVQASRDPNRWTLLDAPRVDPKPVNKKFTRSAVLGGLLGLMVGLFAVGRIGSSRD